MAVTLLPGVAGRGVHLKYIGVVDFQALWKHIGSWFESKGYEVIENKAKQKTGNYGGEFECIMTGWRNLTDYYRYEMKAFCHYWESQEVEVIKDGKKKKLLKARYYFWVSGKLILDYSDRFTKSRFTKALNTFLKNHVLHWQWDAIYGDKLNYKVLELQTVIKDFLKMECTGSEFADMW